MDSNPYAAPTSELTHATDGDGAGPAPYTIAEMRSAFKRFAWAYWSYVGSIVLMVVGMIAMVGFTFVAAAGKGGRGQPDMDLATLGILGVGFMIFVLLMLVAVVLLMVFSMMLLYRYWRVMQPYTTRTTPGKAVGFLFIPFFNLYWVFVAYHGLAKAIDGYLDSHPGSKAPRPQAQLVLVTVILMVISCLPSFGRLAGLGNLAGLGGLAGLGLLVLFYLSKVRLNNSIIGIIADRARGDVATAAPR